MTYKHLIQTPNEQKMAEAAAAAAEKNTAYIEYVAMMGGIDLPEDDNSEVSNNG